MLEIKILFAKMLMLFILITFIQLFNDNIKSCMIEIVLYILKILLIIYSIQTLFIIF